jgi:hypothetical protein
MAESNPSAQPQTPAAPEVSIRQQFLDRLQNEASPEGAQPQPAEDLQQGETEDDATTEALTAEHDFEGDETEAPSEEDAQPTATEDVVITVNGKDYDASTIEELESKFASLDSETKRKWRETANVAAHQRRQFEAASELIETQDALYSNMAQANVSRYDQIDTSRLTPEQFQQLHMQRQTALQGAEKLKTIQQEMREKREAERNRLVEQESETSRGMLEATEPRWSNEFYADVGEFAVNSGLYTADEFRMLGLIAQYDIDKATRGTEVNREPEKPRRKRNRRNRRRNSQGQFQTAQQAAASSPNAKADGSFRAMKEAQLRAERGE